MRQVAPDRQITPDQAKRRVDWGQQVRKHIEHPRVREAYSRLEILEHDQEWAHLIAEMRGLRRRHDAMMRRADMNLAADALRQLHGLRDRIRYGYRLWTERGRWNHFYRVKSGSTHTHLTCRTIIPSTVVDLDWELSGQSREVVAELHKLCRHCGQQDTDAITDTMAKGFFSQHYLYGVVP